MSDFGSPEHEGASGAPFPAQNTAPEGEGGGADVEVPKVLVLPKVSYNEKTRKEAIIPKEVHERVDQFVVPEGYKKTGSRDLAFFYAWGVNLVPDPADPTGKRTKRWICMANSSCLHKKTEISTKDSKSGVGKHLKRQHGIVGHVSSKERKNMDATAAAVGAIEESSRTFGVRRLRSMELQYVRVVIEKLLAFNFGESREVRVLFKTLAKDAPTMTVERTRHIIVEMYASTKSKMLEGLKEAIAEATLPIVHFSVDFWTCKVSRKKFIGVHLFWVDAKGVFRDALVAVMPYCLDPTTSGTKRAAAMLWRIFTATMEDVGVKPSDIASCTTDSGSDVKSMCVNHASEHGILWDWCTSHMSSKALEHAFGTSAEPSKSKNPAARDLVKVVIKVMERLNRSSTWRAKFKDVQMEDLGLCLKVLKHAPQRWLSLSKTLERVIRLWHSIRKVFLNDGQTFPLEEGDNKQGILELYSLLAPVGAIMRDGQHGTLPMNGEIHMALSLLHVTLLSETVPLKVFQIPKLPAAGAKAKTSTKLLFVMRNDSDLTDVGRVTRRELRDAFVSMFTARVWDTTAPDPSFFRDAAVVLVPSFSSAKHLDMLKLKAGDDAGLPAGKKHLVPTNNEVDAKRAKIWDEIRHRAVQATLALGVRKDNMVRAREKKRAKVSATAGVSSPTSSEWAMFEEMRDEVGSDSPEALEARALADAEKAVDDEIERFKAISLPSGSMSPRNALVFWSGSAVLQFPKLWSVAQQVYGNQTSAAQIERDFGGAGQLLSSRSRRSRVDSMYIEMMLFLHLNYERIPDQVLAIESEALNTFLPKRFTGSDEKFEKAMQYVMSDVPVPNPGIQEDGGGADISGVVDTEMGGGSD